MARSGTTRVRRKLLDRSKLSDSEVRTIIDRVKGRVAAAEFADRSGPALRASDELAISEVELGDGIHSTIDEAARSALQAFEVYREMGLETRKTVVDSMRAAMLREGERLAYMAAPGGAEAAGDFRGVGARVRSVADIDREFAAAARRREAKARAFEDQERLVAARASYMIAALLWASARWPIFEITDKLLEFDRKMNECYEKFIQYAPHPVEKAEIDFEGKKMPGYLHLPRAPVDGEKFACVINWPGMDS